MTEHSPRSNFIADHYVDPTVTRLVHRDLGSAHAALFDRAEPVATSASFVTTDESASAVDLLATVRGWQSGRVRSEVIVPVRDDQPRVIGPKAGEDPADQVPLRTIRRELGGRAIVLSCAVEAASHEFVIFASSPELSGAGLSAAFGTMWAEGCDAALIEAEGCDDPEPLGDRLQREYVDAAEAMTSWLGTAASRVPGRAVIMRRWVARWLFNEVARAVDPWTEIADRARLLGIAIVSMDTRDCSNRPDAVERRR